MTLASIHEEAGVNVDDATATALDNLIFDYQSAATAAKAAKMRQDAIGDQIKKLMDAKALERFVGTTGTAIYKAQTRERVNSKALKAEMPAIHAKYVIYSEAKPLQVR